MHLDPKPYTEILGIIGLRPVKDLLHRQKDFLWWGENSCRLRVLDMIVGSLVGNSMWSCFEKPKPQAPNPKPQTLNLTKPLYSLRFPSSGWRRRRSELPHDVHNANSLPRGTLVS